ncbi:phosphoesterase [Paenibacillus sp. PK3_47]|uniref:S-layer homology domain-containing protein n=1 Tax=Paenibacillus sp. PK3_47 TaxID=2072642 RepID=UPI00201D9427|nr:S-layer homology domain-containing protein [Paenibacillus sp. PK3_47]UQZ37574.1 phosphoesterase [Paenibacillus sp. PK3_47]
MGALTLKTKSAKKWLSAAAGIVLVSNTVVLYPATAAPSAPPSVTGTELPEAPAWGHFVDTYKNNSSVNSAVYSNPTIGILSGFLELWKPGSSWDNGTKLNSSVLDYNIQYVVDLAKTRTPEDEIMAYYVDRRNQSYGATEGLGSLADVYRSLSGTYTTINSIPEDATSVKYNDGNGENKAGDSNSELGSMVDLIGKLRGNYASTTPAKNFYSYMRPFRWADPSVIVPTLRPAMSTTPATDGGFPSGHTNASYLASLALAYAVPERFQEQLTRASEMGNSRIVAGMHSPFDVMGGRVMATALAAAALADPDNAGLKQAAYDEAHEILLKQTGTAEDRFGDYQKNKAEYMERLTYGFPQIHSTTKPMIVPKGAEVLLETRLPYLSGEERRAVLATTGLPSGYPVLDDPEGWGRLNLFAAADGYGAFNSDVTVTMDAAKGGFHAADRWRNDISGTGKLTKEGSGTLSLTGNNTYTGGTLVNRGTLEAVSAGAFGTGDVAVTNGAVTENVYGKVTIGGKLTAAADSILELNLTGADDILEVKGAVNAGGKLQVNFTNNYVPGSGVITLITHGDNQRSGEFTSVEVEGLPGNYNAQVIYQGNQIALAISDTANSGNNGNGGSNPGSTPGSAGGTTAGSTAPVTPEATAAPTPAPQAPAASISPFKSGVVSRETVLKAVSDSIAATQSENRTFNDTASHWGASAITAAVKLRIVDGYGDGSFRPNAPVTRAEFAAMIARAFGLGSSTAPVTFQDTVSTWAAGYIGTLAEKGIVTGYEDGSFKPDARITRAEMVTIISRVLDLQVLAAGTQADFADVRNDHWAADVIRQASSANLVQGISSSAFAPASHTTRAEAVTIIIRALASDSSVKALIEGL